ncbi:MAG: bifunctional (p)ppGpp synthetase/guanosine-3',5'-bis(diphosphate) 3'-pyrophosphohydrolase, partial [Bacteroidetes bacterium]|nr:bifunctional (p)ppGpp synthetase/guanosine-3',5'-bis(diphosphate) 3'-pyrophosphohydrolase [Bacteroidota bacterium]
YSIVTDIYKPNPQRLRDWISTPKFNGYESLHTTVMGHNGRWVEVQIRSNRMDEVAEKGFAAHWKYKDGPESGDTGLDQWLSTIRELLENPESDSLDFLDDFRLNLFTDEVYAFTPKGDLRTLPNGSTALDFAFQIHTDVGLQCLGVKVNQKLVPLDYVIKNGDQIEIITSKKQKPSEGWLQFVVSARAKAKIKSAIKDEKRRIAKDGKELLKAKIEKAKITLDNTVLKWLVSEYKSASILDLYYQIGIEKIDKTTISAQLKKFDKLKSLPATTGPKLKSQAPKSTKQDVLLIGDNDIGMDYKFSQCCNPIPGDDIFGYITIHDGIKIHRVSCPNAVTLMSKYDYRILKAQWAVPEIEEHKSFAAGIKLVGIDSPGLISQVTNIISKELKVNMKSISFEATAGAYVGKIVLEIQDTKHLEKIIAKMKAIEGVDKVSRFDVPDLPALSAS